VLKVFSSPVSVLSGLALLCTTLVIAGCDAQSTSGTPRFAILVVDDSVDDPGEQAPPGAERVPASKTGTGLPGALWLKREGGMAGPFVAEAHVIAAADGQPAVEFTLTPEGRDRFAALTRANIGRRLAVVVNGAVVAASIIGAEMADGKAMLSGSYTEPEARALAAELMATATR
jgi:preprotein translocase subunit SecD